MSKRIPKQTRSAQGSNYIVTIKNSLRRLLIDLSYSIAALRHVGKREAERRLEEMAAGQG